METNTHQEGNTTAIANRPGNQNLIAMDMSGIKDLAKVFAESGVFSDTRDAAQAVVKIIAGQELGMPPLYSMNNFYLISTTDSRTSKTTTRITQSASSMAMLLLREGDYNYDIKENTDERCVIEFSRLFGDKWKLVYTSKFTIQDAERAGLLHWIDKDGGKHPRTGSVWYKWPKDMNFNRAMAQGCRRLIPHKLGGVKYTPDEIADGSADDQTINAEAILAIEPAPEPEKNPVKEKGKDKGKSRGKAKTKEEEIKVEAEIVANEQTEEVQDQESEQEAVSDADKDFEELKSSAATGEEEEIKEEKESAPKEKATAKKESKQPDPPSSPSAVSSFVTMIRAGFNDMGYQPHEISEILGCKTSRELEKKYTPEDAYLKLWDHYCKNKKA